MCLKSVARECNHECARKQQIGHKCCHNRYPVGVSCSRDGDVARASAQEITPLELSREEYPVTGLDLSAHNGDIDFSLLAADSIDFVVLKATEGATFKDPKFHHNYLAARKAGIRNIGAYHFFKFGTDGKMQGINLLNSLVGKTLELPLVIDLEEWTNPKNMHTDSIVVRLQDMIDYLESNGHAVMLYTNKDGYERFVRDRFTDYPLWICSFTKPPLPEDADTDWSLWRV